MRCVPQRSNWPLVEALAVSALISLGAAACGGDKPGGEADGGAAADGEAAGDGEASPIDGPSAAEEPDASDPARPKGPPPEPLPPLAEDAGELCEEVMACCDALSERFPLARSMCARVANALNASAKVARRHLFEAQCEAVRDAIGRIPRGVPGGWPKVCEMARPSWEQAPPEPMTAPDGPPPLPEACKQVRPCCDAVAKKLPDVAEVCAELEMVAKSTRNEERCKTMLGSFRSVVGKGLDSLPSVCGEAEPPSEAPAPSGDEPASEGPEKPVEGAVGGE